MARAQRMDDSDALLEGISEHDGNNELGTLMQQYSGRSAVEDSLQSRRGLAENGAKSKAQARTLSAKKLVQIAHTPRDYGALLRAAGSPKAVMSPLAAATPADALVIEFASAADLATLPEEMEARFGMLMHAAEGTPSADALLTRYRTQLALELDGLAKTFGHLAFKRAAVVLSDPYLREGSDVSVLFETENADLLQQVLAKHLASTRARVPDVVTRTEQVEGTACAVHESSLGEVRRFELPLGPVFAVTNSKGAAQRLLRVRAGNAAKLGQSADYKYARALSPHDAQAERAFAFFGDAAVDRINGGPARIAEARRARAESELASMNDAALLHGWMMGHVPANTAEMLKAGWLLKSDLTHQDGESIRWSPEIGAQSAWGRVGAVTPIVDMPTTLFSKDEAAAYAQFARRYDGITSGRLDPTSFRIARNKAEVPAGTWETELRVLPLSMGGEFGRNMGGMGGMARGLFNGGSFAPGATTAPLSLVMALGGLREANVLSLFLGGNIDFDDPMQIIGDWAALGSNDDPLLWELTLGEGDALSLAPRSERPRFEIDTDIGRVPAWAMMHIRSRIAFKALETVLKAKFSTKDRPKEERGREEISWDASKAYKGEGVQETRYRDGELHASLYYATPNDVLVAALRRDVLEARIDDVLAGRAPKTNGKSAASNTGSQASHTLDLNPSIGGPMRRALYAFLDKQTVQSHERACDAVEVLARGLGAQYTGMASERRAIALRTLGFAPTSAQGGEIAWKDEECTHPVLGTSTSPNRPDARDSTPLHVALNALLGAH